MHKGARYYPILKDEFSTFKEAFFLKTKDEAPSFIKGFIASIERETGKKQSLSVVTTTGYSLKFISTNSFSNAESNRNVLYHTRHNLMAYPKETTGLPLKPCVPNCTPKKCLYIGGRKQSTALSTPVIAYCILHSFELYYNRNTDISYIYEFGIKFRVHILEIERRKLDAKCHDGIFLGYCDKQDGSMTSRTLMTRIRISRYVKFLEG